MGQPDIKEIEAGLKDWDFVRNLPAAIGDYTLVPGSGIDGQILNIAAYVHEASHCCLDLTYTKETFDYVPVKTVGLHTFRDVRFFCRDREHFRSRISIRYPEQSLLILLMQPQRQSALLRRFPHGRQQLQDL